MKKDRKGEQKKNKPVVTFLSVCQNPLTGEDDLFYFF